MPGPSSRTSKRKALNAFGDIKSSGPIKQQRITLDAFFAPKQTRPSFAAKENIIEKHSSPKGSAEQEWTGVRDAGLSAEQENVLRMVVDDERNIFFTGSAGTGKSLLLRAIIAALRKKFAEKSECLAVCASTGMAAQNIGGTTIHAWGAVTPGIFDLDKQISFIKTCRPAHRRWKMVKVLIIDEVSMVDGQLFNLLAALAARLRKKTNKPFGGIQIVVTGDFFQLPPVTRGNEVFFAFQSDAWKESIEHTVTLTKVFRQKDNDFIGLLNELRRGEISPATRKILTGLSRPLTHGDGLLPTQLFPLRTEVDRANASRLMALGGPVHTYTARDSGSAEQGKKQKLLENMMAVRMLELKRDAQVMLVKNISETLVNGSVGKVLDFCPSPDKKSQGDDELLPLVEFSTFKGKETMLVSRDEFRAEDSEGKLLARRVQIPLVLAWAVSIHKAQGQTIQRVKVDLSKVFEKGMGKHRSLISERST
ncbi:DNA repair and recombination protein pif1 [Diaporthe amygdali]|uniref:DNA repair and recombination protein pif1 n=1 Tax=Phomopsis amygdali TaxID=1214568 RepID=UPI0022FEFF99|nr:DNA repair and recombination protein pif1 [Diaporthe amygdali]KAJ0118805.1 DNA repair and recombination protein pif1 [Diaporthe amygdali]